MPGIKGSLGKLAWDPAGRWDCWRCQRTGSPSPDISTLLHLPTSGTISTETALPTRFYDRGAGQWYIRQAHGSAPGPGVGLGFRAVPVPGDYDGDGVTDPAGLDKDTGNWFVLGSSGMAHRAAVGLARRAAGFRRLRWRRDHRPGRCITWPPGTWYVSGRSSDGSLCAAALGLERGRPRSRPTTTAMAPRTCRVSIQPAARWYILPQQGRHACGSQLWGWAESRSGAGRL